MGKIRVKTLGNEEQEKKEKQEAKRRKEQKKLEAHQEPAESVAEASVTAPVNENMEKTPVEDEAVSAKGRSSAGRKKEKFQKTSKQSHSNNYLSKAEKVDKNKMYKLSEALSLLPSIHVAKFDETVELHMNTTGTVSGAITLPHGTGKQVRIAIADGSQTKEVDELVKKIESGTIDFDVLIATPDTMPKLARVARVLGPRGLMPNPKNGTVTPKPEEVAKKFAGGQMNFKTEAKAPILHMVVGKMSFGEKKLEENITVAIQTVSTKNIKNVTLKSTMSPGLKLDLASL